MQRQSINILGTVMSLSILLLVACSTEKNTSVNRAFHYVNARYNGHWNANELLNVSMAAFRNNLEEDYYELIPFELVPDDKQVQTLYTPIDTAISKVKKVIADHSMPGLDNPSRKNAENNGYIDENWLTIGRAHYLRMDYETAMRNFKFVNQYFSEDASNYIAEMWMAKTNMKMGKLTEAKFNLDRVNAASEGVTSSYKSAPTEKQKKTKLTKAQKLNNTGKETDKGGKKEAKFPDHIRFDLMLTNAEFQRLSKNQEKTIEYLQKALEYAKKSEDKGRVNFALAQLLERSNQDTEAAKHYRTASKMKVVYAMSFHAKLRGALLEGGPKIQKELEKMLRDAKNAEYRDQIYYTLAELELRRGNEDMAMQHLTNSAFYSNKNKRQKAKAYLKMADLRYAKRDYIRAQKYYDSCVRSTDDTFPKFEEINAKAEQLLELVTAVETAQYEDSVQRIAKMDPVEQEQFLKDLIKKREEEERLRKQREAEKLRELAANQNAMSMDMGGKGGGYWNNSKSVQDGFNEFKKIWGQRENEDNWRRSEKLVAPPTASNTGEGQDGEETEENVKAPEPEERDPVADLRKGLPASEEDFENSNKRMEEALYKAGIIYKEQLNEPGLGVEQFEKVVSNNFESDFDPMAAFQLYRVYENQDASKAAVHKDYILNNFPLSDFAKYMRDPEYFVKRRERENLSEQEFVSLIDRYNRGLYYPVMMKAESMIEEEGDNIFKPKFMLIHAMANAQVTSNKGDILPMLDRITKEYPDTEEAKRAADLIDIVLNGYSKHEPVTFGNKYIFEYEDDAPQIVLIFLGEKDNIDIAKTKVADFTREFFPKSKLKVTTTLLDNKNVIMVSEFPTDRDAKEYSRKYQDTRKHLLDLQKAKRLIITPKNIKILFQTNKLEEYQSFFEEYY